MFVRKENDEMISFIKGEAGSGKSTLVIEKIKQHISDDRKIFVIIPEQFSFEYERKLYAELSADVFNKINVLSFTRLAKTIFDRYGCRSGEYADENTKAVLMYLTLKEIQNNRSLMYFNRQASGRAFINDALDIVADLRRASVNPDTLASRLLSADKKILEKAHDISLIYTTYDRILQERGYRDGLTDITEAAALANMNDFFEGSVFFIDEFDSFSPDEYEMIDVAAAECSDFYISLCTPETEGSEYSLFAAVNGTYNKIKRIAEKYGKSTEDIFLGKPVRFRNDAVCQLSSSVFRKKVNDVSAGEYIRITEAKDLYKEADFVCSYIKYLVLEKNYRYGEISIVSRQLADYDLILQSAMERYEIPYFSDIEKPVMHTSAVLLVTSLLELAGAKSITSDMLFRYAKTMLTKLDIDSISELENFCYKWNIDGEMWETCFSGTSLADSEKREVLEYMDTLRESLVVPVLRLRQKCRESSASELCRYIYEFMEEEGINRNIRSLIADYKQNGMTDMASEINRIYSSIMDIFDVMNDILSDEKTDPAVFGELFELVLKQNRFLSPPQRLDIVSVVSAEKARLNAQKVVFVMGANEGILPYAAKQSGMLSDTDKEAFAQIGVEIGKDTKRLLTDERFTVYRLFSAASERVIITYPLSDLSGGSRYPSYLLRQISSLYNDNIMTFASDYDDLFYSPTKKSAYYNYVQSLNGNSVKNASLRAALMEDPEYFRKISYLDSISPDSDHRIDDKNLMSKLFGNKLAVSATSFEEYNLCHFKYYCRYALRIAARGQKEINTLELGKLVHMCLEHIFSGCASKSDFLSLTDEQITEDIKKFSKLYKEKNLGGEFGKNTRLNKRFERLTEDALMLINHLKEELRGSEFVPARYEFEISEKNGVKPVTLTTKEGVEIVLNGKIDRIDIFEDAGERFVRIVDYKTGVKKFNLDHILFGIDMQMLLYLFSITGSDGPFGSSVPAGVLYMPSGKISLDRERSDNDGLDAYLNKYYHMSGVLLKELRVLQAMEEHIEGIYIPAKLTSAARKKGSFELDKRYTSCLTRSQFERLRKHTDRLLTDMAEKLYSGDISASPLNYDKKRSVCSYCDYHDICGNYPLKRERLLPDDIESIKNQILGEED
ncbi:MAG: hypothetical protein E7505_01020 [Ruminococcus sp.]|nr:hypothetical protein [Ruminococcus sp.]